MKNFIHTVFEKYGVIKLFGSFGLTGLFLYLFDRTGMNVFLYAMVPFALFFSVMAVLLFVYGFINFFKDLKK